MKGGGAFDLPLVSKILINNLLLMLGLGLKVDLVRDSGARFGQDFEVVS